MNSRARGGSSARREHPHVQQKAARTSREPMAAIQKRKELISDCQQHWFRGSSALQPQLWFRGGIEGKIERQRAKLAAEA
eukprot:2435524-Prymnesium_polylepis.1